jgi:hypothetical protein
VEERDGVTSCPAAGNLVDQLDAGVLQACQSGRQIRHAICYVVESGAATLEETGHGPLRVQGLEDLDGSGEGHSDSLGSDLFGRGTRLSGDEFD